MHAVQVVEKAVAAVRHLKSLGCDDIEFSPEDATRSDPQFLYRVLTEVIKVQPAHARSDCSQRPLVALLHAAAARGG